MTALTKRCYVIGGCTDCPGHISAEHIDILTEQLVENCKTQCAVLAIPSSFGPCALADNTIVQSCDVIYGNPCQKYLMDQVRSWAAEVDFPSVCTDENGLPLPEFPAGHLNESFDPATTIDCPNTVDDFTTPAPNPPVQTSAVKKIQNP